MAAPAGSQPNRLERRKARTRAALIGAAQSFLADGRPDAPILDITRAADVGLGSFYNHFTDREQLFHAAVVSALDGLGATFDVLTGELDDPAEVFARSFRLLGRLHRREPILSKVLLNNWATTPIVDEKGLVPRVRRDLAAGVAAGRFAVGDIELTLALITGAAICLGRLLHDDPDRDDADSVDRMTEDLLRTLGLPAADARELSRRPLPPPDISLPG
ncbi:TetR/AcrR family transcriptional regulator [Nocardia sp. alder85J]|uniref:TetR/AcrR family transcriptional regulator n=1 Tax=Nocardia sp. alder85J TaxID=2862949 RepID=UPI001CD6CB7D|nr:TetR/AcrR family transcriptional regulator [Nocardia sp. alder85J]MCX4091147.1 TetR/AcrR family transcriptional regulator [Nocardia sp. alder85J]